MHYGGQQPSAEPARCQTEALSDVKTISGSCWAHSCLFAGISDLQWRTKFWPRCQPGCR